MLVLANTAEALVDTFQREEKRLREAFDVLTDVEKNLTEVFTPNSHRGMRIYDNRRGYGASLDWAEPERVMLELRRQAWRAIIDRTGVRRFMSIAAATQLDKKLDDPDIPAVTMENLHALVDDYTARLEEMHREAVREVFEFLRPDLRYATPYKTNSENEIGRRVILERMIDSFYVCTPSGLRVRHDCDRKLIALENVFSSLAGDGLISKSHWSELHTAIKQTASGETKWFRFRAFKKGTLHLTFKRPDLVAKLNKIAGGKRLKNHGHRAAPEQDE